jgi:hypothetical protein
METIVYDEQKFAELMLYIAQRSSQDAAFGRTKLNKILFYADFVAYGRRGQPITGAVYQKMPQGPVPSEWQAVRERLKASGAAVEQPFTRGLHQGFRLVPLREPNLDPFTAHDIAIVDNVIDLLRDHDGSSVSELSHQFAGWRLTNIGEQIPYFTVCIPDEPIPLSPDELEFARQMEAQRGQRARTET